MTNIKISTKQYQNLITEPRNKLRGQVFWIPHSPPKDCEDRQVRNDELFCLGVMVREIQVKIPLPERIYRLCVFLALYCRKLRYGYTFRRIPLTQGKYAIVDPERYEEIAKYKWYAHKTKIGYYALRMTRVKKGNRTKQKTVRMHWVILEPPEGKFVDHINHNTLDNRRANLRIVTNQQNMWNMRKRKRICSSKYKGVHWSKFEQKWRARIQQNNKSIFLGQFDDEKAAAKTYDQKAKELFGEYAALNLELRK